MTSARTYPGHQTPRAGAPRAAFRQPSPSRHGPPSNPRWAATGAPAPAVGLPDGGHPGFGYSSERVEYVEPAGAAGGHDRRDDSGDNGDADEHGQRPAGTLNAMSYRRGSGLPRRRGRRRAVDQRRADQRRDHAFVTHHATSLASGQADRPQHPSSRVRSKTASTSVLTIPNRLITTESASRT